MVVMVTAIMVFEKLAVSQRKFLHILLKELATYLDDENTEGNTAVAVQLNILAHLVPCRGRKRLSTGYWKLSIQELPCRGRKRLSTGYWKLSIQECIDSLVQHAINPGKVDGIIKKTIAKA
ncbi:hypothetical protein QE152_g12601 [Popillia japonica]|uniref:Uncharacterized protein n=1 Tax=Popillia japonica TaxID=7064 RepID=A0AAW1LN97_POPJA